MTEYKPYVCDPSKALATFGDVNFIQHDGQLLVPGVEDGEPYLEIIETPPDDMWVDGEFTPDARWTVYRVEPEPLKLVESNRQVYLVTESYQPDWSHPLSAYDEWFHKDLESVANSLGLTMEHIRDRLCSSDVRVRAGAYIDLASYFGWYEFDQYPLHLTQHEVHERYGMVDSCECAECNKQD